MQGSWFWNMGLFPENCDFHSTCAPATSRHTCWSKPSASQIGPFSWGYRSDVRIPQSIPRQTWKEGGNSKGFRPFDSKVLFYSPPPLWEWACSGVAGPAQAMESCRPSSSCYVLVAKTCWLRLRLKCLLLDVLTLLVFSCWAIMTSWLFWWLAISAADQFDLLRRDFLAGAVPVMLQGIGGPGAPHFFGISRREDLGS